MTGFVRLHDGQIHRDVGALPRILLFKDAAEKARWLDASASIDATTPELQAIASRFKQGTPAQVVEQIHRFVRDSIAYKEDPGGREEFADPLTVLKTGYDDCDGKARLFVALVRALRDPTILARIVPVFDGRRRFVHVQADTTYPGAHLNPYVERSGWLRAELIVRGVPLGGDPLLTRDPATGVIPLAGPKR